MSEPPDQMPVGQPLRRNVAKTDTVTTGTGNYTLLALPAGTYSLIVEQAGIPFTNDGTGKHTKVVKHLSDGGISVRVDPRIRCENAPDPSVNTPIATTTTIEDDDDQLDDDNQGDDSAENQNDDSQNDDSHNGGQHDGSHD